MINIWILKKYFVYLQMFNLASNIVVFLFFLLAVFEIAKKIGTFIAIFRHKKIVLKEQPKNNFLPSETEWKEFKQGIKQQTHQEYNIGAEFIKRNNL